MSSTIADRASASPNRTAVRRVQPNLDGGKPTDPLVLAFEGDLEGLIGCENDLEAFHLGLDMLGKYGTIQATISARLCISPATPHDERRLRALRDIMRETISHLHERADRLEKAVIPELRRICTSVDDALNRRASLAAFERTVGR